MPKGNKGVDTSAIQRIKEIDKKFSVRRNQINRGVLGDKKQVSKKKPTSSTHKKSKDQSRLRSPIGQGLKKMAVQSKKRDKK